MGWVRPKNPEPICSRERCKSKFQVQRIVGAMLGVWYYDNRCEFFCACHGYLWHNPSKVRGFTFFWPRNRWVWYLNWFSLESNLAHPPKVRTSVQALPRKGAAFTEGFSKPGWKQTTNLLLSQKTHRTTAKNSSRFYDHPLHPKTKWRIPSFFRHNYM